MSAAKRNRDEATRWAAERVVRTLRAAGFEALFAGGCVRDRLLGIVPKDYDVATSARPEEVIARFDRTEPVGAAFGVVLVMIGDVAIEVATFRSDGPYSDGRHPDRIEYSTPEADAARRDFTINAMFLDPETGDVIDFVGGRADLEARRLRTVGDARERFAEDRLRTLRAVRFAARVALTVDEAIPAAAREVASGLSAVSRERRTDELNRILIGPNPARAIEMIADFDLFPAVLPALALSRAIADRLRGLPSRPSLPLAWATLAWGADLERTFEALRLSRDEERAITAVTDAARTVPGLLGAGLARQKRLARADGFADGVTLAVIVGSINADEAIRIRARAAAWSSAELRPPIHLDGHDLIALGVARGPAIGEMLTRLEDAALDERLPDRETAERYVREWLAET